MPFMRKACGKKAEPGKKRTDYKLRMPKRKKSEDNGHKNKTGTGGRDKCI